MGDIRKVAEHLRTLRLLQLLEQTRQQTWDRGLGGAIPTASPMFGTKQGGQEQPEVRITRHNGRHIVLRGGPYIPDGSPIEWHTVVRHLGWDVNLPTTEVPFLAEGYYDAKLTGWFADGTEWKGDVTVEVRIGGQARHPTPETGYACGEGLGAGPWMLGRGVPGQRWEMRLTADTIPTSAQQTLPELETIEASMQLVDRQVGEVNEPSPEVDPDEVSIQGVASPSSSDGTLTAAIPGGFEAGDRVIVLATHSTDLGQPTVDWGDFQPLDSVVHTGLWRADVRWWLRQRTLTAADLSAGEIAIPMDPPNNVGSLARTHGMFVFIPSAFVGSVGDVASDDLTIKKMITTGSDTHPQSTAAIQPEGASWQLGISAASAVLSAVSSVTHDPAGEKTENYLRANATPAFQARVSIFADPADVVTTFDYEDNANNDRDQSCVAFQIGIV